jgi:hypothetical protein
VKTPEREPVFVPWLEKSLPVEDYAPRAPIFEEEYPQIARTVYPPLTGDESPWTARDDVPFAGPEVILSPSNNTGYVPSVLQRFDGFQGDAPHVVENEPSGDSGRDFIPGPEVPVKEARDDTVQPTMEMNTGNLLLTVVQDEVRTSDDSDVAIVNETSSESPPVAIVPVDDTGDSPPKIAEPPATERIVLVPTGPQQPKPDTTPLEQRPVAPPPGIYDDIIILEEPKAPLVANKFGDLIVDPAVLKRNSYYIQLVTTGDLRGLDDLLTRYAGKYPFALVPVRLPDTYQVLVGPLTEDEYGVVLARFKHAGYRDAFLRKTR